MAFSLSPAVTVNEKDLTTSIVAAATNTSAVVGRFEWGSIMERTLVTDQDEGVNSLVGKFGKSQEYNFNDFFQAWNYLAYANSLQVVRVVADDARNAADGGASAVQVFNLKDFENKKASVVATGKKLLAKYTGERGNNITVRMTDAANYASWNETYKKEFEFEPTGTEFAVLVEHDGDYVERFIVDRVSGNKDVQGITTHYSERINRMSDWIWIVPEHASSIVRKSGSNWEAINNLTFALTGGVDGGEPTLGQYQAGADLFKSEQVDFKTIIQTGGAASGLAYGKYILENVAANRKDCHAITSPVLSTVVGQADPANREVTARTAMGSSSYGFWASNYKYQYDKYNDVYRWVSFAGDVAGVIASAAEVEPWQSPAGYDHGKLKNVNTVAYEQSKPQRDILYKAQCNPIFVDGADGCVLLGDKTMQNKPSAFQYYNVRAIFITMEKAIATSAKYQLFKYNDEFTRLSFKNMVLPYLRNIQARRGIVGFAVVCDERNNTPFVIDAGQFKATILIKPNRTIQGVGLDFVATSTGVDFTELTNQLFNV